jgi:D-aspartate ligase
MKQNDPPVLILGSGLTALGVLRSLGRAGLSAYSVCHSGELAAKSRWYRPASQFKGRVPLPEELAEYLGSMTWPPKAVLMSCSDDWTRAVAELPEDLKGRYPASIATARVIAIMTDKAQFAQMLDREDVPRPKTIAVQSLEELSALPDSSFENMFLKPLDSQTFSLQTGSKAFQIESRGHALRIMAHIQSNGTAGFPILLQEYIPGPADRYFLIDGFVDRDGQNLALFARRRYRMYPPPFGNTTLSETVPLDHVQKAIKSIQRILSATKYRGIFSAEFKYDDRDGQFKIVEINARPWWFVEFASRCGVNVCRMSYGDALGLQVEPITSYAAGRRCVYMFYDFAAHRSEDPGVRGFVRWIRSLKGAEEIVYCLDDPGPGMSFLLHILRRLFTTIIGSLRWPWQFGSREPSLR